MIVNLSNQYLDKQSPPDDALVNLVQRMQINLLGHGSKKKLPPSSETGFILDAFLILCVHSGQGQLCHKEQAVPLPTGSFFLLLPGEIYHLSQDGTEPFLYIYIYFKILPISLSSIFKKHTMLAGKNTFQKNWYRQIGVYLAELCQPVYRKHPGHNFLLRHVTEGIVAYILHEPVNPIIAFNYPSTTKDGVLVELAYNYTLQHLAEPIQIDRLAQELATSRSTLDRVFQHVMKLSPSQAITRFKILHSLDSLKKGTSIKEIALAFGYSSSSHFSRAFKSVMSMTPTEYILK